MVLAGAERAAGQVFKLEAGTSSLYQAHGGSVGFHTHNYDGWVGVGSMDGFRAGAFMRTKIRGSTLTFGDDAIPFHLGTDVFDTSHYFMGRGVGLLQQRGATQIFSFAGATSRGTGTPYFRAGEAEKGVGLLFLDHRLTPKLMLFSRNVFSSQQSSISGLEWQPRAGIRASLDGGIGANEGYGASSFTVDREMYSLKASYIIAGDQFRRITVQQPISSEVDRENVMFTLRPTPSLAFTVGRQNFLQPFTQDSPTIRGSVNQYSATFSPGRLMMSGTFFDSSVMGMESRGASFSAGRDVFSRLHVTGNYLWNRAGNTQSFSSLLGTFRETISPRLSFLQVVNYAQGQTTASFGGNFVSNRISVGIEYQTLYLPFLTGNQFKQALVLNFQFRPFGNYSFNAGSYVTPDGRVKYTAYGGTYMYRGALGGAPGAMTVVSFHKYLVQGKVVDEAGKPIRGAALRIDADVVYSDSGGYFSSRRRRPGMVPLEVLLNEFIVPGLFEVVSAPSPVKSDPEDAAKEITIVLRRLASSFKRNLNGFNQIAEIPRPKMGPSVGQTDAAAPASGTPQSQITEVPITTNINFALPLPQKYEKISAKNQNSDQQVLISRAALPIGLGEGPVIPGQARDVPRGGGTKSVQSAKSRSTARHGSVRRSRVRSSRVKHRGRHARRSRSRVVRSDSRTHARGGGRLRSTRLKTSKRARGPQLASAPRKDLSGRVRGGG